MKILDRIKVFLKSILPPSTKSFMREISLLKNRISTVSKKEDTIIELNENILHELDALNEKINSICNAINENDRKQLETKVEGISSQIEDIRKTDIVEIEKRVGDIGKNVEQIREGDLREMSSKSNVIVDKIVLSQKKQDEGISRVIREINNARQFIETQHLEMMKQEDYPHYLKEWYINQTGKVLNLDNPKTYNENVQWLKLFEIDERKTRLADKYLVRDWIKEKVGEGYLIKLFGVYDRFDEINFEALPEKFVIKANHGSGMNVIVKDKTALNIEEIKKKVNGWLKTNYAFKYGLEMQYNDIPRKILIEEYLENSDGDMPDYKFWCFNGKVKYIELIVNRQTCARMAFYDTNWNKLQFSTGAYPLIEDEIVMPKKLNEMIQLSETLSKDFIHVRVDLYLLDDELIKFGEMTFTSSSGTAPWKPIEADLMVGNILKLPYESENELGGDQL